VARRDVPVNAYGVFFLKNVQLFTRPLN